MNCKFCGFDPSDSGGCSLGSDQMCDGCWEIHHRLGSIEKDAKIILSQGQEYVDKLKKALEK